MVKKKRIAKYITCIFLRNQTYKNTTIHIDFALSNNRLEARLSGQLDERFILIFTLCIIRNNKKTFS